MPQSDEIISYIQKKMKTRKPAILMLLIAIMTGFYSCASIPKGATAVTPFDKEKYLGKWYEIARLDFRFEGFLVFIFF